ncbi:hypothetical protein C0995_006225 [Termitomyces sp. Mi166|nr:hypothetical protein C0995_006225 [Termitomyces sp. Mi166\
MPIFSRYALQVKNPPDAPEGQDRFEFDLTFVTPQATSHDYLGLNVGPTRWYLKEILELSSDLQDQAFYTGQSRDSEALGDAGRVGFHRWWPDWDDEFSFNDFDGIIVIATLNEAIAENFVEEMEAAFGKSILKLFIKGKRCPGHQTQNDHFGYRNGISNPGVRRVTYDTGSHHDGIRRIDGAFMITRK